VGGKDRGGREGRVGGERLLRLEADVGGVGDKTGRARGSGFQKCRTGPVGKGDFQQEEREKRDPLKGASTTEEEPYRRSQRRRGEDVTTSNGCG